MRVISLLCALLLAVEASARTSTTPAFMSLVFGPPQQELQAKPEPTQQEEPNRCLDLSELLAVDPERLKKLVHDMLKERQWETLPWPVKAAIGCAPFCITGVQSLLRRRVALKSATTPPTFQANSPEAEIAAAMAPLVEAEIDAAMVRPTSTFEPPPYCVLASHQHNLHATTMQRQAAAAAAGRRVPEPWMAPEPSAGEWPAHSEATAKNVFQAGSPDDEVAAAVAAAPKPVKPTWSPSTAAAEIAAAVAPVVEVEIDLAMRRAAAKAAGADAPAAPGWPGSTAAP